MSNTITVPAATRSVISATPKTTFKVGTYNTLTDTFTSVVDLNDHVNYWLVKVDLPQPKKAYARTSTIRAAGERVTAWNYQNRHITLTIHLLYESGTATLLAAVRSLISAIETPPYRLAFAAPNSTVLTYADVVAVSHNIPTDGKQILAQTISNITIDFECAPGLAGDRIILDNQVVNPGFEAPAGSGVQVFSDGFANLNAYTNFFGSAPTLASNVMTIPASSVVTFGSPVWQSVNLWTVRFKWVTGLTAYFDLHSPNTTNRLGAVVNGSTLLIEQYISSVAHDSGSVTATLTNGNFYWITLTQFPCMPNTQCDVQATLYNDSVGAIGSQIATTGPQATFDTGTAFSGQPGIGAVGAALQVGGAFSNVHTLNLFGPGAWTWFGTAAGSTGLVSAAWDQSNSNTYPGGAVTSFGAARLDLPPAGTINAGWTPYTGGAPAGTQAIAASATQTLGLSAYARSSGLHATHATVALLLNEYDSNGNFLRQDSIASALGGATNGAWTQLAGTVTLGTSCAYVAPVLSVVDTSVAGESANATVWFDNTQCYNQTTTGQTVMPYCEMRFPQSPAQWLVTGLQGDMAAPAFIAFGGYLTSWAPGASLSVAIGRRALASANARLVGQSNGFYGNALSPTSTPVLDGSSYSGYFISAAIGNGWNPRAFSFAAADAVGVYHLASRFWTNQSVGNLPNVNVRVVTPLKSGAWLGATNDSDKLGEYDGPYNTPVTASSTWTPADGGQANVPALPVGALTDLTQNYLTPRPQWADSTGGGSTGRINWQMLLPVDGAVFVGTLINPSNGVVTVTTNWLWSYVDGFLANQQSLINGQVLGEGATYSVEGNALPNPGHAGGGPGTTGTGAININSLADPYLTVDPNVSAAAVNGASGVAAGGAGVNQFAGYMADNTGAIVPLHAQIQYVPLYLYPRQS